jgi:hypothetical protein
MGTPGIGTPSVSSIPSIALDAAGDRLYVATQTNALIFDNIGAANGNVPFSRLISATVAASVGPPHGVNFFGLSLDTTNDVLYTVDPAGEVHIFNNASSRTGQTTPERTITPNLGANTTIFTFGIAIDVSKNMLYVGVQFPTSGIIVFNNASTAATTPSTSLAPDRTLNFSLGVESFFLDTAHDRLYVAQFNGPILVFDSASTLATGTTPTPNRTITLGTTTNFVFVDTTHDRLYAVNNGTGYIINNASAADGPGPFAGDTVITVTASTPPLFSAVAVKP